MVEFDNNEIILFKLNKKLNSNEKNKKYEIVIYKDEIPIKSVLSIPKSNISLDYNHYYKAEAYINKVQNPKNDYQFNYAKFLERKDIYFLSYLPNGFKEFKRNDLTLAEKIKQKRLEVLLYIDNSIISKRSREFLKGIILSDRTEMDSDTIADFTNTGLVHILAISGSHIAIIFGIVFWFFNFVFYKLNRKYIILSSLIFIWSFAIFIDYGNPVVRSCMMITIYYTQNLLQRKVDLLHSIGLSAFLILLWDTHQIFDIGFQLSFVAVLGIYWFNASLINCLPESKNRFQKLMWSILSITISAQLATLPLILYYFHQYPLSSFISNLIIIPIAEIIIIFSLLLTVILAFGFNFDFVNIVYDKSVDLLLNLIHWLASFDFLLIKRISFSMLELVILSVAIYFLRFLIIKYSSKNFLRFSYSLVVFFMVRVGVTIYYIEKKEILVHHYFKENMLSIKEKGEDFATFWIKEDADKAKINKFIIDPYLTSRRISSYEVEILPKNINFIKYKNEIIKLETY